MRERTTWNTDAILKKAALNKKADPYTMNQSHPQPAADKYVNGDPSSWAEDVHKPDDWAPEYSGGEVKRDEIGLPEMRPDTMNHKEKTATALLVKKADFCVKLAQSFLPKTASEAAVEDQAVAFMELSDAALISSFDRLANEQEGQQAQQAAPEDKQAQQEEPSQEAPAQQQMTAAPQQLTAGQQLAAAMQSDEFKTAFAQLFAQQMQQGQGQQAQGQVQASSKRAQDGQQAQQAPAQQEEKQAAPQVPVAAPVAAPMIAAPVAPAAQQQEQQMPWAQDDHQAGEQAMLDQMLAGPEQMQAPGPGMVDDIEMDSGSGMDFDDSGLGPEDADLQMLFSANQEAQDAEEAQQAQSKQAAVRTASTRTLGTKPSNGVSRLGGFAPQAKVASTDTKLDNLWATAPDVKSHFGQR